MTFPLGSFGRNKLARRPAIPEVNVGRGRSVQCVPCTEPTAEMDTHLDSGIAEDNLGVEARPV